MTKQLGSKERVSLGSDLRSGWRSGLFSVVLLPFLILSLSVTAEGEGLNREMEIRFLDVGEGDSTVIDLPSGRRILVDAGNVISGPMIAAKLEDKPLDVFIITHPHPDHFSGAFAVLHALSPKELYDNGEDISEKVRSDDLFRWYEEEVRKKRGAQALVKGREWRDSDVVVRVLSPKSGGSFEDWNANSAVLSVERGSFRVLLMGDANSETERILLAEEPKLRASVLRVGHHGSSSASSAEFLRGVQPREAIVSVNRENIRGYPSAEVLERIEQGGATLYRTDRDGTVTVTISSDGRYRIKTEALSRAEKSRGER